MRSANGSRPTRRSKAEATTGLAPKKASAHNPLVAKIVIRGVGFKGLMLVLTLTLTLPTSLVELQRSGGLGLKPDRIVVTYMAVLHVAQNRRQIVLFLQRPVRVVGTGRCDREGVIPPRNELLFQVLIGLLERACTGHAQPFHQSGPGAV